MSRPVLLLEINEVPWRLIDRFSGNAYSSIDRFFSNSRTLTNVAIDSGELSPWVTWPTFHRGMPNEKHGIKSLGQDPSTFQGVPIWKEFRNRGYVIGIFGSLQSWPPVDPGEEGFYVPDTFAHDSSCIPASLEPLQRFNLGQTASNRRVVGSVRIFSKETLQLLKSLSFVRSRTLAGAAWQILSERVDKVRISRRPVFQATLMWDAFRKLFDPTHPPAFATFFTNHVAGVMHRYWHNVFPKDFGLRNEKATTRYLSTMKFAMNALNRILTDAMAYCAQNPSLVVVFASSMGQSAVHRSYYEGVQLVLKDFGKLANCLRLDRRSYRELLAMDPQTAIEIKDAEIRKHTIEALASCRTIFGEQLFSVEESCNSLSITMRLPSKADIETGYWKMGDLSLSWPEGGIEVLYIDPGTGYHIPEGAMAVYGEGISPDPSRQCLQADQAKDYILKLAGVGLEH